MRLFFKILKIVCFIFLLLCIAIGIFVWRASIDKTDTFYLLNADLINPDFLNNLAKKIKVEKSRRTLRNSPSVYAHRVKQGNGMIFGFRWYSNGSLKVIDDEEFEKITIWLSKRPDEKIKTYSVRFHYVVP